MSGKLEGLILEFFDAENKRDWSRYQNYLSSDVEWKLMTVEGFTFVKWKEGVSENNERDL